MEYLEFQALRRGEGADDKSGVAQPLPELLSWATAGIGGIGWTCRLVEQENQPWNPGGGGGLKLQFGVRNRLAWYQ